MAARKGSARLPVIGTQMALLWSIEKVELLRIPKGCKKVAWGKRSAAPGTLSEKSAT
jgi:hypothetical protein